jgi:hypothetical protein
MIAKSTLTEGTIARRGRRNLYANRLIPADGNNLTCDKLVSGQLTSLRSKPGIPQARRSVYGVRERKTVDRVLAKEAAVLARDPPNA